MSELIPTPWDKRAFGLETYEIQGLTENLLSSLDGIEGHFTIKVAPTVSKALLHRYGFYYCDTLIEPYCTYETFQPFYDPAVSITESVELAMLTEMCLNTFTYDRFHRDFKIDDEQADQRYVNWLTDLYHSGSVFGLRCNGNAAGFFAYKDGSILLHALSEQYRGKGLAKYFWSEACRALFSYDYHELSSSISAANLAILNVYSKLGFSFRNPVDVYHKVNAPAG
ncbi:acetyltransferase (GNAT) family protein [Scopulibacillus darangshiensis]|uniref:Acetyltransferase (GNAT) family protein n=1 Tax=Scopulibacillus darangshiensis TaxID=442528 RepID=A0A4R2NFB0_9BACL|nr:GNAT family N-acetyltransferase [Scopulibacillus darangshiensis]TCP19971.1 acetyltransferase (GNAT) family protein [Scopulibacillus darangshiensis]